MKEFFKKRLWNVVSDQLRQGITPEKISLSIALGCVLAVFPILGTTALLCFAAALILKLNQPLIHTVNYLLYPVQIILIPFFIRVGEKIFSAVPVPFSLTLWMEQFAQSPALFAKKYGTAAGYAVVAWGILAPLAAGALYWTARSIIRNHPHE